MAANCDLAIIPIDQNNNFVLGKPEKQINFIMEIRITSLYKFHSRLF